MHKEFQVIENSIVFDVVYESRSGTISWIVYDPRYERGNPNKYEEFDEYETFEDVLMYIKEMCLKLNPQA